MRFLERRREPGDADFRKLVRKHPELADELEVHWTGLQAYRRLVREARSGLPRPQALHRRSPVWRIAAAGLVVALSILVANQARAQRRLAARQVAFAGVLADVVQGFRGSEDPQINAQGPRPSATADTEHRLEELAFALNAAHDLSDSVASMFFAASTDRVAAGKVKQELLTFEKNCEQAPEGDPRRELPARARRAAPTDFGMSPLLVPLRARLEKLALTTSGERSSSTKDVIARILDALEEVATLRLRVIDLDDGGTPVDGARVFVQEVELPFNTFGPPKELERTSKAAPLDLVLSAGDWRITVVDPSGLRHSELRVLALAGADLGLRVAFLRATDDVIQDMAHFDAATVRFGNDDATRPRPHFAAMEADVGELWMDPYETSCEDYAEFFNEVKAHPEWFDGRDVVPAPRWIAPDWSCPPELQKKPALWISWDSAQLFANWRGKRLPTEREWERVAEGIEGRRYAWGNDWNAACADTSGPWAKMIADHFSADKPGLLELSYAELTPGNAGDVNDSNFAGGATPEAPGGQVWRLNDNAGEFTEDLFVLGTIDDGYTCTFRDFLLRCSRSASYVYASETACLNDDRCGVVPDVVGPLDGIRCVKTPLPAFAQ